ncbi:MAG TPA: hypothetical protein VFV52_13840 [Bacilli bacterium]|nr:hypothetical protein [Bacilli bacterium]
MLALFIWGFALYGIFVVLWKIMRALILKQKRSLPVLAVLIVHEGASYIEGILRTLTQAEPFAGRDLQILVLDCGSRDETAHIVEAIARKHGTVRLVRTAADPYHEATRELQKHSRTIQCLFDLRGKIDPLAVVPTLASFWHGK